jgi:hypothetical protein
MEDQDVTLDWITFLGLVDLEDWVDSRLLTAYGSTVSTTDRAFPPGGVTVSR